MRAGVGVVTLITTWLGAATPADAACVHVVGAKVWLPGGKAADVEVVLDGELIRDVGVGLTAVDCERVDARGKVLTAGFVDAWSALGLMGIELEPSTVDVELKTPWQDDEGLVRAAARASLAFDPRSEPIRVARAGGVTSALAVPRGGVIAGQAFWIDLAGDRAGAIRRDPAAMVAALRPHATATNVLDVALAEAAMWGRVRAERERMRHPGLRTPAVDLDALQPVVAGTLPLAVAVDRAADIEGLLALTAGTKVRPIVVGGAEAWLVRDALAARGVPVVLDPLLNAPYGFDQLAAREDNAALLHAAGVPIMLSAFNPHQARKLRQLAGNAVRAGLPWEAALVAISETPARVLGLERHGRIAKGAIANVVLWSGDPFELDTRLERLWIHGVDIAPASRQSELLRRYRSL